MLCFHSMSMFDRFKKKNIPAAAVIGAAVAGGIVGTPGTAEAAPNASMMEVQREAAFKRSALAIIERVFRPSAIKTEGAQETEEKTETNDTIKLASKLKDILERSSDAPGVDFNQEKNKLFQEFADKIKSIENLTEEQKQAVVEVIGFGALAIFEDVGENFSPDMSVSDLIDIMNKTLKKAGGQIIEANLVEQSPTLLRHVTDMVSAISRAKIESILFPASQPAAEETAQPAA